MATTPARSKKPVLKTIHTWIGIIAGLFLSVVALSGSLIVFRATSISVTDVGNKKTYTASVVTW